MAPVGRSVAVHVAIGIDGGPSERALTYAAQLGVAGVVLHTPSLPGEGRWPVDDLRRVRELVERHGLRVDAIENTPASFYDKAMLGLPGRDEQIRGYCETIRAVGQAGIGVLGFHWMPNGVWRTAWDAAGRAGVRVSAFDAQRVPEAPPTHGRLYGEAEQWASFEYFLRAVVPVAEEAGVRLALHPDDPPVESLGGIARLFRSFAAFRRAIELVPSPAFGLNFCVGSWSEMGIDVIPALRWFTERGKIVYVHLRDVQGAVPRFQECFLAEGNVDPVEVVLTLRRAGFDGFMIDDHVPALLDDTDEFVSRGHAHATGYMLGLLAALERVGAPSTTPGR
jgi:mannonate dehydratase